MRTLVAAILLTALPVASTSGRAEQQPTFPGQFAVYEVRLTFTGHTGSLAGHPNCQVRNGKVVMTGLVGGDEKVARDDDIEYRGVLQYDGDVDLCEVSRPPGTDRDRICTITVAAKGPLATELSVYADDRGGYVKATKAPGTWTTSITGSCDASDVAGERANFPDESMANVFNGEELPLPSGPLRVGRYARANLVVEVLRVVRRP